MTEYLFTSESVTEGDPDKMADRISDVVVNKALKADMIETFDTENVPLPVIKKLVDKIRDLRLAAYREPRGVR